MPHSPLPSRLTAMLAALLLLATFAHAQQPGNRPIGIYPGNPDQYYGPALMPGGDYRNLALHRMVWQSSSYDFNLTSQLLTDGIVADGEAAWLRVATPDGELPVHQRESAIDGNDWTSVTVVGGDTWLQYDWHGMSIDVDEAELVGSVAYRPAAPKGFALRLLTSADGRRWRVADEWRGDSLPGTPSRRLVHSDPNKSGGSDDDLLPTRNIRHRFKLGNSPTAHLRLEMDHHRTSDAPLRPARHRHPARHALCERLAQRGVQRRVGSHRPGHNGPGQCRTAALARHASTRTHRGEQRQRHVANDGQSACR